MLKYNELKKGTIFLMDGDPYEVLEYSFVKLQRQRAVVKTKIKNLKTGVVLSRNFQQSDAFKEPELEIKRIKFIYTHRDKYIFAEMGDSSKRFELPGEIIDEKKRYLKENTELEAILLENEIIDIRVPIKMDFKIIDCPPSFRGDTAQAGRKSAIIETGAKIEVPMFIKKGDIIRINTEEDKYTERVK